MAINLGTEQMARMFRNVASSGQGAMAQPCADQRAAALDAFRVIALSKNRATGREQLSAGLRSRLHFERQQ